MLLTESFDIKDYKGINRLLTKYRLAPGAHMLVNEGKVLIPYEDGAPPNKDQRIGFYFGAATQKSPAHEN